MAPNRSPLICNCLGTTPNRIVTLNLIPVSARSVFLFLLVQYSTHHKQRYVQGSITWNNLPTLRLPLITTR